MRTHGWLRPISMLLLLLLLHSTVGSYVITTPRKWTAGAQAQICVTVSPDTASTDDELRITVYSQDTSPQVDGGFMPFPRLRDPGERPERETVLIPSQIVRLVPGQPITCRQLPVPVTQNAYGRLSLAGSLGGTSISDSKPISIATNVGQTFIQTDKKLYKAGQKVQFRVLTLLGPTFKVSTDPYPEIIVETPSGSRIAQWLNVSNPSGLLHLDLQLIEEPEEGVYTIKAKSPASEETQIETFSIKDYVLPRFEVTVKPPKYLLADATLLNFEVCAMYTFGQPVKGTVTANLKAGWGTNAVDVNFQDEVSGCKMMEIPLNVFDINSKNFIYSISTTVSVEEKGTGNIVNETFTLPISRSVVNFMTDQANTYRKPELPYVHKVTATLPDGSPVAMEPMEVCLYSVCKNFTTDSEGILRFAVPPHLEGNPVVKDLNYANKIIPGGDYPRPYMYESSYTTYSSKYYSPSNSSLTISPESTTLQCQPGQTISLTVPVMFSSTNVSGALIYVQVTSRGQVQYWNSQAVSFSSGPLVVDDALLLAPLQRPFSPFTVRGTIQLAVSLPPTTSPTAKVLVWYSRPDGEVVSDVTALKLDKCLEHRVGLSWSTERAEQDSSVPLTMTAEPSALCSLGIVDKSVELLASSLDSFTLDTVFNIADRGEANSWENSQINDYVYCQKKKSPPVVNAPSPEPVPDVNGSSILLQPSMNQFIPARTKRSFVPPYPYDDNYVDAVSMFQDAGLYIISDLTYETRPCRNYRGYCPECRMAMPMPGVFATNVAGGVGAGGFGATSPAAPAPSASDGPSFNAEPVAVPRVYFPETWLWELSTIPPSGTSTQELTLPNTVTEWVGRAVCVHPSKGLGISPSARVTAFTPFFIDLTVLPTVKKGEVMPVIISVFNYLDDSLPVRITLEMSAEYEILGAEGPEAVAVQKEAGVRVACVPKGDKETVTVRIRPLVVGDINVTVSAVADTFYPEQCGSGANVSKVDRIISPINVEYEGFPREKTWNKYMCSKDLENNIDSFEKWRLQAPRESIPETERGYVTVVGDLMGLTLENLGNLIKLPYGCGEQNMLNFAPNIFVLQYLNASRQATEATTQKIKRFMMSGYQRELNYKHRDGSYSAFGERDDSGSTWLTAFVVKSFSQARQYIDVDASELAKSTDWLKNRQLENGCFESVGKVLHKEMKGGLAEGNSPAVLTAYVMAALLEAGEDVTSTAITKAATCLQAAGSESQGPYYASLKAYALSLARLPQADQAISDLLTMAVDSPIGLYWELPPTAGSLPQPDSAVSPVAVETAGYALLAMMIVDPKLYSTHGHRLVKWISGQRNSQGGFISTQDTVVALQALAAYAGKQAREPLNLSFSVTGDQLQAQFKVVESNKLLTQRAEVPIVPTNVQLGMTGTGCALVQGVVRYSVTDPSPSEAFSVRVSSSYESANCKMVSITTCAGYLLNDLASNMAVIEVGLVSGYTANKEDLKKAVTGSIKRFEVDGNKVLFYVDQLTIEDTCVRFTAQEEVKVENAKPGTAKVYDYYQPEFFISETFVFPPAWSCWGRRF